MSRAAAWLGFAGLFAAMQARADMTVATVGDSLADAIYLGLKLQPSLLRQDGIRLERWSRPSIGLTRVDYFDYTSWLRDTSSLGSADYCIVEMGANDLQSIDLSAQSGAPTGQSGSGPPAPKWVRVGTDDWQRAYADRVRSLVDTLRSRRCNKIVWLLQPAYQKNKYLGQYHEMINAVQLAGAASSAAAFEIAAGDNDYSEDGVHPNKDFCFRLGRAVANLLSSWQQPFAGSACASCHASPTPGKLIPSQLRDVAPLVLKRSE